MAIPQLRYALEQLVPWWLRGNYGRSFIAEGLFTVYDWDAAFFNEALFARYPSYCHSSCLPLIGRDRRIVRGSHEGIESYRVRLRQWLDVWRLAGTPLGLMVALQGYLAPYYPQIRIVTRRPVWYALEEGTAASMLELPGFETLAEIPDNPAATMAQRAVLGGRFQRQINGVAAWDWDSLSNPENATRWWHFWVIICPPHYPLQTPWDTGDWVYDDPLESWGFDEPYGTYDALKQIVKDFKPAKSRCVSIIFPPTDLYGPFGVPAAPIWPDGWWGAETKLSGGIWVPTRYDENRYLFPEPNN